MGKKFLSAVLCAALAASIVPCAAVEASAAGNSDYGLAQKTSDGVILHAFDWSYNTIKEKLPEIAEAGYTTVQTSPVQAPKDYVSSKDTNGQWWKLYQPLGFSVAEKDSWLGTKSELTELCAEADKYGIKIICDIVSNHLAKGNAARLLSESVQEYEPEIYADYEKYVHQYKKNVNDSTTESVTQGSLDGLPDLNTSEPLVQERVVSLLKECIDCGVDGFRFDAAKHIETPDDEAPFSSEFWPTVLNQSAEYAKSKGVDLYCYGEVLNSAGFTRDITYYTKYLDVTDNKAGDATLGSVVSKNAANVVKAQGYGYKDVDPSHFVLWAESHDTYMGDSGSAISNTSKVSNEDIAKAWAIVAARSESKAVYLARPGALMGQMRDTAWKSTVVSEVNKFHNSFIGVSDQVFSEGDVAAVQRGDSGIVLVNLGEKSDISISTKNMKDGSYTDAVTGNTFTVKNGTISGKVGSTGVAVVYEGAATNPKALFSVLDNAEFKKDTMKLTITLENAVSGTYSVDGAPAVEFKDSADITIGEGVEYGSSVSVKVTATNGTKTVETTQTYNKVKGNDSGVFVYFDNLKGIWQDVYVYVFYEEKDAKGNVINTTQNAAWPGVVMDYDDDSGYNYYELPKDLKVGQACVIFNNTTDQTKTFDVTSNSMLYTNNTMIDYDPSGTTLVYGDLDNDNSINSLDALKILRASVDLEKLTEAQKKQSDVDGDDSITAGDSLYVLRYSVGLKDNNSVGKEFLFKGYVEPKQDDKKEENIFYFVDKAGWIFSDGCKLWVVNDETKEAIETDKESPLDDKSTYAYANLPKDWKKITVCRTKFDAADASNAYNTWACGEIQSGSNAVNLKNGNKFEYTTFEAK